MGSRRQTPAALLALLLWQGCQPPPPVGRAADPTPPPPTANTESAELLRKVDQLEKELKDRPKNFAVKMALGRLYYENERFVDAARMFRLALDEKPDENEARKLLANSLFFLGNPDTAIKLHEEALAANPNDSDAMFFLGAILVESRPMDVESLKRAQGYWKRFILQAPTHPRRKELEEQIAVLDRAIKGEISLGRGEPQRAGNQQQVPEGGEQGAMGGSKSFEGGPPPAGGGGAGPQFKKGTRVPALAVNATPTEKKRAEALDALDEGRFLDARNAAEAVLQASPDDLEVATARARSLVQLGEAENAIRAFGEVIKKRPNYAPAWHYLGMAHMMNNDAKRAAQTWKDLMEMDPAYAQQFRIPQRLQVAERMAQQKQ